MATQTNKQRQEFKVSGKDLKEKIKKIIKEGNARRIIIENEKGERILEIPFTLGAIGAIIAPILVAVGAIGALLSNCTIVVVKK